MFLFSPMSGRESLCKTLFNPLTFLSNYHQPHKKPLPQLAKDPEIQAKLKEDVPFTQKPSEREKPPIRKLVKSRLYCDDNLAISEMDYMREHSGGCGVAQGPCQA